MKFIELFAGIGGFRYGLEQANNHLPRPETFQQQASASSDGDNVGITQSSGGRLQAFSFCYANEWDKYAAQIYRRHYGEIDTRDIRDVSGNEIPEHDLLTAGFPCQDFSIAGKGVGLEGTRGTLFFEIARILSVKKPRHFLLENVKGLLSNQDGKTFITILGVLADLGYRVEWMVLNSKHFGVPQNRERVFIIGHLRGRCGGEIFPVVGSGGKDSGENAYCLDANYGKGIRDLKKKKRTLIEVSDGANQGQRIYNTEGLAKTLVGEAGGQGARTGLYAMRGREQGQQLEFRGDETNSLTSVGKDNLWLENARIRRLTPTECERLQAFEDGFTEFGMLEDGTIVKISDTQRYKCLGNAVTTTVITAIGQGLLEHLGSQ